MKPPQEYVDLMDQFLGSEHRAVKIEGANKEDAACFTMIAHLRELSVEVIPKGKIVFLRKKEE